MGAGSGFPERPSVRRSGLTLVSRAGVRVDLPPLGGEPGWWAAAPLREGRRALSELPGDALMRLTEHYLPFVRRALRPYRDFLAGVLGDREDVDGQAGEWLLDAMRRYDPGRGVPFAGYLASRVPYWVADAARGGSRHHRYAVESETAYARAAERSLRERHRPPTLDELAAEFGEDPARARQRMQAVAVYRGLRRPADVDGLALDGLPVRGDGAVWTYLPAADGEDVDALVMALDDHAQVTRALIHAACDPGAGHDDGGVNASGLWTLLLEQFGEFTRRDLERAGRRGRATIVAAQARLLTAVRSRLAAR